MKKETTTSKKRTSKSHQRPRGIVSKDVRDYGNDPFIIRKTEQSRKFLEKHGFPELPKK